MGDHEPETRNDVAPWLDFDANAYLRDNYATVLPEDAEIIRFAGKFLVEAHLNRSLAGPAIDVGAGPNLYPSLLMLPWAERIVFAEYAPSNIEWLKRNLTDITDPWPWQPFWDLMSDLPGYRDLEEPRRLLANRHEIRQLSIFELPPRAWSLGSMFFVADGISSDLGRFEEAVAKFLAALTPQAPFLMAFMEGSTGYAVNGVSFPAVNVSQASLERLLASLPVTDTNVLRTDKTKRPLRIGYEAMLLVTGYVIGDL